MPEIERYDYSNKGTSKPTETKPKGPNKLEQSLYSLKKESTSGSTHPEFLDAATDEQQADLELTLARSAMTDGPRSMYRSNGNNPSDLGERKGGGNNQSTLRKEFDEAETSRAAEQRHQRDEEARARKAKAHRSHPKKN